MLKLCVRLKLFFLSSLTGTGWYVLQVYFAMAHSLPNQVAGENNSNDQSSNPTSGEEDTGGRDAKTPGGGTMREAQGSNPTNYNSGNGTGSNGNGSNGNGSNSNGDGSNRQARFTLQTIFNLAASVMLGSAGQKRTN